MGVWHSTWAKTGRCLYNPHVFCDTNRSIYLSKGINSTKGLGREKPFGAPKEREHVIMDVFYSKNCPKKSFCNMDWKRCLGRAAGRKNIGITITTKIHVKLERGGQRSLGISK